VDGRNAGDDPEDFGIGPARRDPDQPKSAENRQNEDMPGHMVSFRKNSEGYGKIPRDMGKFRGIWENSEGYGKIPRDMGKFQGIWSAIDPRFHNVIT
jgi:hypothetical protein